MGFTLSKNSHQNYATTVTTKGVLSGSALQKLLYPILEPLII